MAPRILPIESPDPEVAELLAQSPAIDGRPLNIFGTLAHHPKLFRRYNALGGVFLFRNRVPARDREIVILRVAWRSRAVYEFGQHTRVGLAAGLTEDEVARVARDGAEGWSAEDAGLIRLADELCENDRVGDQTWSELAGRFGDAEMIELVLLAGFYRMTAGMLNSIGVETEPGVAGWPPGADATP